MLFTPEELGWIAEFTAALQAKVPVKKWTDLLHHLVQMGVAIPGHCACSQPWELETWLHKNHAMYNNQIRAAIMATGAREGLYKALYRDINGPNGFDETYGRVALRSYGRVLLDFLRFEPTKGWFRAPVPPFRLYQGGALDQQERSSGLSH
jgi:hypothetical protein